MPPPSALPPALLGRPFLVAEALALGTSRARLRAGDLRAPHRGVRVERSLEPSLALACAGAALLLPAGAAFSGTTAVELLGLPTPWADGPVRPASRAETRPKTSAATDPKTSAATDPDIDPDNDPEADPETEDWDVEVAVPRGLVRPRIAGLTVRPAGLVSGTRLVTRHGLPLLHPSDTWAQRCVDLPLEDAVALGDAVRRRATAASAMADAVARLPDRVARRRAQAALALVRHAVDSPAETRLRLAVVRAGLPEPDCGAAVPAGDHPVAWPDLSWPRARVAAEVDGLTHLEPRQRHLDLARGRLLTERGWLVVVVSARDVWRHPEACVAQVRAALLDRWPR